MPLSRQFVKAKINEKNVKRIVIGVNSFCSILFFEIALPNVLNRNRAVIIHKIIVIILWGKSMAKKFDCSNIMNRKNIFIEIDTVCERYISLSDFNLPPQTKLYGMIFNTIKK